jgi:hypothetical protein
MKQSTLSHSLSNKKKVAETVAIKGESRGGKGKCYFFNASRSGLALEITVVVKHRIRKKNQKH